MWRSYGSSSGGDEPTEEQLQQWSKRMHAPDNELPASVGITVLLGRTEDAAVGLTQVEAFSTGFRFSLAVRLRQGRPELAHGGLLMLVGGHVHPGFEIPMENRLLLGLEYSDGRRASTLNDMWPPGPSAEIDDQALVLASHGGGGDELSVDQSFWVSPLPPADALTVILAWPGFGLHETRTVINGAAIVDAAAHSRVLWPPQPAGEPPQPPPPPRPSSGWFAQPPN